MLHRSGIRYLGILLLLLLVNSGFIWAFGNAASFYSRSVTVHTVLAVSLFALFVWHWFGIEDLRDGTGMAGLCFGSAGTLGMYMVRVGPQPSALTAHVVIAFIGVLALIPFFGRRARQYGEGWVSYRKYYLLAALFAIAFPLAVGQYRQRVWRPRAGETSTTPFQPVKRVVE